MVRNSVAVQTGADPITAGIQFAWGAGPSSFFPEQADRWLWPLQGARIGDVLILFFSQVKATPNDGLGFAGDGWRAVRIDNSDADPKDWHQQLLTLAGAPAGISVGTAVLVEGDFVYALCASDSNDHSGFLARWKSSELAAGNLDALEWWDGTAYRAGATPAKVLEAGPECSLHHDAKLQKYVHVRSDGFGQSTIVMSTADKLEGPWSSPRAVFTPPEDDRDKPFVYAAKAHPELGGDALAVTYVSNTFADFSVLVNDTSIYYPRFVRLTR